LNFTQDPSIVETSGTIKTHVVFTDENDNTIVLSKSQKILIKDIGDGEVYKLIVIPNSLAINAEGSSDKHYVSIAVNMIKNGVITS
jgi:hypothetical protein